MNKKSKIEIPNYIVTVIVILGGVLFGTLFWEKGKTFEGGAEIIYQDGEDSYHLLLSFNFGSDVLKEPEEEREVLLAKGNAALPSQLYIYKEGSDEVIWREFLEKVESYSIDTKALDGAEKMDFLEPLHSENFPHAALFSPIAYNFDCGTNEIWWTLNMKNGDTIRLCHKISVKK